MTSVSSQQQEEPALSQQQQQQQQREDETTTAPFRVLALHGSEGTAAEFTSTLDDWKTSMKQEGTHKSVKNWQVTSLQAPFPKGSGYAWWKLLGGPNERSFTANRYEGFETSANLVQEAMASSSFDVLFGHSQGAILLTALLALGRLDNTRTTKQEPHRERQQRQRILLNGVAWPNPFGQQLLDAAAAAPASSNNSSSIQNTLSTTRIQHDILLIIGKKDRINPPEQARQVQHALEQAGHIVQVLEHAGGHSLPQDAASLRVIEEWLFSKKEKMEL